MSCIIKQRTPTNPGIMVFTHGEVLWGVIKKSEKVRRFLLENTRNKKWIFGVHVQADIRLDKWPLEEWQKFIMWPDTRAAFLSNVPKEKIIDLVCVNFTPDIPQEKKEKKWDVCIISRASKIKRIRETVLTMKKLMELRPETKILFVVPDNRSYKSRFFADDGVDMSYFDLPLKIFSEKEMENISFISSSNESFGLFPVSGDLILNLVSQSKFAALFSHREGTPRIIPEAFMSGTPCITPKSIKTGIRSALTEKNCLFIDDDPETAAKEIADGLDNYSRFEITEKDIEPFRNSVNSEKFKAFLNSIIKSAGAKSEGEWYLDNLPLRLAGHSRKHNFQFMDDPDSFFYWVEQAEKFPYDNDKTWRDEKIKFALFKRLQKMAKEKLIKLKSLVKIILKPFSHAAKKKN